MIVVEPANPLDDQPAALLAEAQALQAEIYPPEHNHSLPTAALSAPDIRFFAAREGDRVLGVGALALRGAYGEVKAMFTSDAARGKGVAAALLRMIEDCAREEGLPRLCLETGDELEAAVRLYDRFGFARCGPFGEYIADGSSVFMAKDLT